MRIGEISPESGIGAELLTLQRAAYAVEAELIGDDRIPPLHESLPELRSKPLRWLGAVDDDRLVGAVAWAETATEVDVDRLVVHPGAHRRGVGRSLVQEVMTRAGDRTITVSTGRANHPARALYERLGFALRGETEVIPGLWVVDYVCPG
ncbi:GNAT family N-acetyltransferase [Nonomuraea sp. NPDC048916]|uniref:GNAT family N-acetyltransferase n=1 Tax=Nonomuraea sp. NPDC048916 TaxID=3154232 RepID=UPI00340F2335